jgi:hypothetical protein
MFDYSAKVSKILHEHDTDCDAAAKHLTVLIPEFQVLGSRIMKVGEVIQTLPAADREALMRKLNAKVTAFQSTNPDLDALDERIEACMKSSAAFSEVVPKVIFKKRR